MQIKAHKDKIKALEKAINQIAQMYFLAISKKSGNDGMLHDSEEGITDYEKFVIRVRKAFERLSATEKIFINNDFFYEDYPYWWKERYNKASYYKIRTRSMINFKEAFDHES